MLIPNPPCNLFGEDGVPYRTTSDPESPESAIPIDLLENVPMAE